MGIVTIISGLAPFAVYRLLYNHFLLKQLSLSSEFCHPQYERGYASSPHKRLIIPTISVPLHHHKIKSPSVCPSILHRLALMHGQTTNTPNSLR